MSYRIRWLHLSDFHVGKDNYGQLKLFRSILDQIKARVAKSPLDFVFITGDVAQSGTAEQYELFHRECLEPLQQLVGQDCQILIVPGNHDLDRTQAEFVSREKMRKSLNFFDANEQGRKKRRELMPRFQQYHEKITFPSSWLDTAEGCFVERKKIRGIDVGILGINTAWLAQGDDEGFLSPGQSLVEKGLAKIKGAHVRIVLGHHPIDWFSEQVQRPIQAMFGKANVLYLHGHLHQTESSLREGAGEPYLSLQTGAAFQAREDDVWRNRVLWAELNAGAHTLKMDPFVWNGQCQEWAVDGTAFPMRFEKNGYWILPLPGERTFFPPTDNNCDEFLSPTQAEKKFTDDIIQQLNRSELVVILSQAGRKVHSIKQTLLDGVAISFAGSKIIHLSPPQDPDVSNNRYFQLLGKQARFKECNDYIDWTSELEERLRDDQSMLLLITAFENGPEPAQRLLAGELRRLWETYPKLKIVLFGGQSLAQQVYETSAASFLNIAVPRMFPELTVATLQRMVGGNDLTPIEAERILTITGSHPALVAECLDHIGSDYQEILNETSLPSRLFVRYRQDSDKIREWLQREVICPFEHWPTDKRLRRLYWDNLITKRNRAFVWRCELIRTWGIQQLGGV